MFSLAKKIAKQSTHRQHHHAVIITCGGAVVSVGSNINHKHAEIDAIGRLKVSQLRKKLTLWSFRWRKNGTWGQARPCEDCEGHIKVYGITKVWYTDDSGKLVRL